MIVLNALDSAVQRRLGSVSWPSRAVTRVGIAVAALATLVVLYLYATRVAAAQSTQRRKELKGRELEALATAQKAGEEAASAESDLRKITAEIEEARRAEVGARLTFNAARERVLRAKKWDELIEEYESL